MIRTAFILLLFASTIYAQTFSIKGDVKDPVKKEGLNRANVLIISAKDSTRNGALADKKGHFEIENVKSGKYFLTISYIGYKDFEQTIFVKGKELNLGNIELEQGEILKKEITVEAQMPTTNQNADTVQYNAQAFKVNKDATAEDLIQKMPGVTTEGGTVKAQGENIKQVLVDGKTFFGEDPTAALKNLPAEVIDKVQIYDKQSDQAAFTGFDDGNAAKTMNIVTKSFMRKGQFGNISAGYGDNGKYSVGGIMNFFEGDRRITLIGLSNNINKQNFSPDDILGAMGGGGNNRMMAMGRSIMSSPQGRSMMGGGGGDMGNFLVSQQDGISTVHSIGFNYSDTWSPSFNISGSYFFNYSDNDALQTKDRNYISAMGTPSSNYLQDYTSQTKNINHRANFKLEYNLDSNNRFVLRPRLTTQLNDGASLTFGRTFRDTNFLNSASTNKDSYLTGYNFGTGLTYMHRFNSDGRSATIDYNYSKNKNDGDYYSDSKTAVLIQELMLDTTLQPTTSDKVTENSNVNLTYNEPLSKYHQLQANYYFGVNNSSSDVKTYDDLALGRPRLDSLSNVFENKVIVNRPGINYRYQSDSLKFSLGFNYEWNNQKADRTFPEEFSLTKKYESFLPNAMLQYNISKQKNLRFNYRASTDLPSIDKLQDVVDNTDPTQLSVGNSDLKQSYKHSLGVRYSAVEPGFSRTFFAMANVSFAKDYIANSVFTAPNDTVVNNISLLRNTRLTRPTNLDGYVSLSSFITYGMPLEFIQTNLNSHAFFNYSKTPGLINGEKNYSTSKSASLGLTFASNISQSVDFTIMSSTTYTNTKNSLTQASNTEYYSQSSRANFNFNFWDLFTSQVGMSHQYYWKISDAYNPKTVSLNFSIGKKFLANNQGEIKLSVVDALNASKSVQRNTNEQYIEDVTSNVIKRYLMLSFTYTLRNFGGLSPDKIMRPPHRDGDGPGGGPGGPPPGGPGGGFSE